MNYLSLSLAVTASSFPLLLPTMPSAPRGVYDRAVCSRGLCVIVEYGKVWLEGEYGDIKYMFKKHFHGVGRVGLSFHKVSEMEF